MGAHNEEITAVVDALNITFCVLRKKTISSDWSNLCTKLNLCTKYIHNIKILT